MMVRVLAGFGLALLSCAAAAQVQVSGDLRFLSDDIDRGLSLSDTGPTGQAGFEIGGTRIFGGGFAGYVQDLDGRDVRARFYAGASTRWQDAYDVTLTLAADSFHGVDPGENSRVFFESRLAVARDFGLVYFRTGLAASPHGRWSDPKGATLYPFFETQVPIPRLPWLTALGEVGYSAVFQGEDRLNWRLGLTAGWRRYDLRLSYTDTSADSFDRLDDATAQVQLIVFF